MTNDFSDSFSDDEVKKFIHTKYGKEGTPVTGQSFAAILVVNQISDHNAKPLADSYVRKFL